MVLRMSSLIVLMGTACDILKPIFTNNSSIHSLSHCFGKLHVQQLKQRLTKPLRTCRRLMNVQLIGFCNMPTQNIGQNCISSESAMGTSPRISLNHSIHGSSKHEKCLITIFEIEYYIILYQFTC